jgi:hypothetical protein
MFLSQHECSASPPGTTSLSSWWRRRGVELYRQQVSGYDVQTVDDEGDFLKDLDRFEIMSAILPRNVYSSQYAPILTRIRPCYGKHSSIRSDGHAGLASPLTIADDLEQRAQG